MPIHTTHIFIGAINAIAPIFDNYVNRVSNDNLRGYYNFAQHTVNGNKLILNCNENQYELDVNDHSEIARIYRGLYDSHVTLGHTSNVEMKLVFYFVINDIESLVEIKNTVNLITSLNRRFSFEFVGITPDVINSINGHDKENIITENGCADFVKDVIAFRKTIDGFNSRFILISNQTANGTSINFSKDSIATILAEYALVMIENYYQLYPQTIYPGDITGLGISIMSLDKLYFVNYLKDKAYLEALNQININQQEVDVNKINNIVRGLLKNHFSVFQNFYQQRILPLIQAKTSALDISATATSELDSFIDDLYNHFISFIDDKGLSLPEKQAVFALLLGIDDQLLFNFRYDNSNLQYDDCFVDSIATLIKSNNRLVTTEIDDNGDTIYISGPLDTPIDEYANAWNPYTFLRTLKSEIVELSSFVRNCEDEIKNLEKNKSNIERKHRRLTEDGFVYDNVVFKSRHIIDNTPLQDTYEPTESITKKSVDLSNYFTGIKCQGELGACTSFAITSIYEYILNRTTGKATDLSEGFVFYHTNVKSNKIDKGSTYKDVIDVMSHNGICDEDLYPYEKVLTDTPSEEAEVKAKEHILVKAMNVRVTHKDITSAISEGYPVAISLKVFESFSSEYKGLISLPTEEEISAGKSYNHAMVVCGYDEDRKLYKVRNSWGEKFGDKGYCYVPFDYIDNEDLNPFCCIVVETRDGKVSFDSQTPEFRVNLDETDVNVKIYLLQNTIREQKKLLAEKEISYKDSSASYQKLLIDLRNPSIINQIRIDIKNRLDFIIQKGEEDYTNSKELNAKKLDEYKKDTYKFIGWTIVTLFIFLAIIVGFKAWDYWWILCIPIGGAICGIPYRFHRVKLLRNELIEDLASIGEQLRRNKQEKDEIDLKLYIASYTIKKLQDVKHSLTNNYNAIITLIGNLRVWYQETSDTLSGMDCIMPPPIMSVLDNTILTNYFDNNKDEIVRQIDLIKIIKDVIKDPITDLAIKNWKEAIEAVVNNQLYDLLSSFNMYSYLSGQSNYVFLKNDNLTLQQLLIKMSALSTLFIETKIIGTNNTSNQSVINNVNDGDKRRWRELINQSFCNPSTYIDSIDPNKLIVVTTKELNIEDVVINSQQ